MANEKRLIDANELTHFVEERTGGAWIYKPDFLWAVTQQPTVDAVEVVRCEKCKHCNPENGHCDHPMSTTIPVPRKPDDFCSYGERKVND